MKYRLKGASGALTGRTFEISELTRIGGGPDCDISIDGLTAEQAVIIERDGGLWLESSGECLLNGEPVERAALQSGDELRLGAVRLVLQAPGLKPARVLAPEAAPTGGGWRLAVWLGLAAVGSAAVAWWWLVGRGVE